MSAHVTHMCTLLRPVYSVHQCTLYVQAHVYLQLIDNISRFQFMNHGEGLKNANTLLSSGSDAGFQFEGSKQCVV